MPSRAAKAPLHQLAPLARPFRFRSRPVQDQDQPAPILNGRADQAEPACRQVACFQAVRANVRPASVPTSPINNTAAGRIRIARRIMAALESRRSPKIGECAGILASYESRAVRRTAKKSFSARGRCGCRQAGRPEALGAMLRDLVSEDRARDGHMPGRALLARPKPQ